MINFLVESSGISIKTSLSNQPGLIIAESNSWGLLVAPITITVF